MIDALDHIVIAATDLDAAAGAYEALLGRAPQWRQEAAGRRARFQLANTALELAPADDRGEGLSGFAFSVSDFEETRRTLERRGVPSSGSVLGEEATHGIRMTLVQREPTAQADSPGDRTVIALDHAVVATPSADRAAALYGARLGLDFRLDRANPQWGSRLLFFRCGHSVIEVSADLQAPTSDAPDRLTGLAWRVDDPDAARARIAAAGFDVSEVRTGRKPGTRVFTVRAGVVGAPALMIGPG